MSIGVVVGIVVVAAALAGAAVFASRSSSSPSTTPSAADRAQRAALVSWEAQIHPAVLAAGQVVALGPRQGVSEIANHTQPDAQLRGMAIGWHARLAGLRVQIAGIATPVFLQPAEHLLNLAIAGYVDAARSLFAATSAHGARRTSLLAHATASGRAADRNYDEAVATIASLRARLDLAPDWSAS